MVKKTGRFAKGRKGFTLIELLVVIAIIGLLATIVLVSLNSARGKAANTTIKANLKNVMTQAELVYDTNSSYANVCGGSQDGTIAKAVTSVTAASGGTVVCNASAAAWAISSPLKVADGTSNYWCVDSNGNNAGQAAVLGAGDYQCP
jgi:prepilin-type N-terminal cleavage/methylation domain-containing protein